MAQLKSFSSERILFRTDVTFSDRKEFCFFSTGYVWPDKVSGIEVVFLDWFGRWCEIKFGETQGLEVFCVQRLVVFVVTDLEFPILEYPIAYFYWRLEIPTVEI